MFVFIFYVVIYQDVAINFVQKIIFDVCFFFQFFFYKYLYFSRFIKKKLLNCLLSFKKINISALFYDNLVLVSVITSDLVLKHSSD